MTRSEKWHATMRERYGENYMEKMRIAGRRGGAAAKSRGYFGFLRDEGMMDELKDISARGGRG